MLTYKLCTNRALHLNMSRIQLPEVRLLCGGESIPTDAHIKELRPTATVDWSLA